MLTGRFGFTVIVIVFEVAGVPVGQIAFDVRIHDIRSPDTGIYEYVKLLVPTMTPFTFH